MRGRIPHLGKIVLFVLLSLLDLFLTLKLLRQSNGGFYEGNPVANYWLTAYGWPGLVCYKLGLVLCVISLVVYIARLRSRTAGRFLGFACGALTVVVVYSGSLVWAEGHERGSPLPHRLAKAFSPYSDQQPALTNVGFGEPAPGQE